MQDLPPRRKRRPAAAPSLDCLPPEIFDKIVSCLPLRDSVRTSALSRTWRHRWESVPGLCIGRDDDAPPAAFSAILARYACPVREFHQWFVHKEAGGHMDEWLRLLAGKGVQSLTLFYDEIGLASHTIHPWIFSCVELTDLRLGHCLLPSVPSCFTGFPNLKSLSLTLVSLPEHGERDLEAIIKSSPSLRSLELMNVWIDSDDSDEWVIQAPNLENLIIESDGDDGWQLEELSSLQRAIINVDDYDIDRDFVKLLTCFTQVTHLDFYMPSTEGDALEGLTCCFKKLKSLTLRTNFRHVSTMLSTFSLLRSVPNLVKLEIEIPPGYIEDEEVLVDTDFFNSLWTNDMFANLDIVTMKDVPCWSNEMHLIEFVLSKARLLSAFYIYRDDIFSHSKPPEETIIKIAKYKRASPKAMVFFRNMDDYV